MTGPDFGLWLFFKIMKWPLIIFGVLIAIAAVFSGIADQFGTVGLVLSLAATVGAVALWLRSRLPERKKIA